MKHPVNGVDAPASLTRSVAEGMSFEAKVHPVYLLTSQSNLSFGVEQLAAQQEAI